MIFTKKFDIHSIIHFLGCYSMVPTFMEAFKISALWASIIAFILALGWEALDEFNKRKSLEIPFLDSRGGDYLDIIVDFVGVLLAFLIFKDIVS